MNRVGEHGKGESIWLAWFLHSALTAFARLADGRDEPQRAATWRQQAAAFGEAIERDGWTASGIDGPILMTERRSDPLRAANAASTQSCSRGA